MSMKYRTESDFLGEKQIPADALWGIHTARAIENFPITGRKVYPELIHAFGEVKLACAQINTELGFWDSKNKATAIEFWMFIFWWMHFRAAQELQQI